MEIFTEYFILLILAIIIPVAYFVLKPVVSQVESTEAHLSPNIYNACLLASNNRGNFIDTVITNL